MRRPRDPTQTAAQIDDDDSSFSRLPADWQFSQPDPFVSTTRPSIGARLWRAYELPKFSRCAAISSSARPSAISFLPFPCFFLPRVLTYAELRASCVSVGCWSGMALASLKGSCPGSPGYCARS